MDHLFSSQTLVPPVNSEFTNSDFTPYLLLKFLFINALKHLS